MTRTLGRMQALAWALACLSLLSTGCKNSLVDRALVFSTHTTVGLEISVSPTEAQSPVSVVLGYKRFEGVLNPVYYDHNAPKSGTSAQPREVEDYYLSEAYSVIAKLSGEMVADATEGVAGKISGGQWFATGEAATILAAQPGIAGAVSGSPDVADAAAVQSLSLGGLPPGSASIAATSIVEFVRNQATAGDADAVQLMAKLDRAANRLLTLERVNLPTYYDLPKNSETLATIEMAKVPKAPGYSFLATRLEEWRNSVNALKRALTIADEKLLFDPPGDPPAAKADKAALVKTLKEYEAVLGQFEKDLYAMPELNDAAKYTTEKLGLRSKP